MVQDVYAVLVVCDMMCSTSVYIVVVECVQGG